MRKSIAKVFLTVKCYLILFFRFKIHKAKRTKLLMLCCCFVDKPYIFRAKTVQEISFIKAGSKDVDHQLRPSSCNITTHLSTHLSLLKHNRHCLVAILDVYVLMKSSPDMDEF